MQPRTLGVEEELLLVDERTGHPVPVAPLVLATAEEYPTDLGFSPEMHEEMVELIGPPHSDLRALSADVARARLLVDRWARRHGARAVPLAISPLPVTPHPSPGPRYRRMVERYGITPTRCVTCGMHVHVFVDSAAEGVAVLDRIRGWLHVLRALTASSPFFDGVDTGYDSNRFAQWNQWPSSGPAEVFGDEAGYHRATMEQLRVGVLLDEAMVYADARLSARFPTVEVRVADVPLSMRTTVTIAGLVRGMVASAAENARRGGPPCTLSASSLRLASWQASLDGLSGQLMHPQDGGPRTAAEVVRALLRFARPGLVAHGDLAAVTEGVERLLAEGNGAQWLRREADVGGSLRSAVLAAADTTAAESEQGTQPPLPRSA